MINSVAGWVVLDQFLHREYRHLQQEHAEDQNHHSTLTVEEVEAIWRMVQTWQLLRIVEIRCRKGTSNFPRPNYMEREEQAEEMSGMVGSKSEKKKGKKKKRGKVVLTEGSVGETSTGDVKVRDVGVGAGNEERVGRTTTGGTMSLYGTDKPDGIFDAEPVVSDQEAVLLDVAVNSIQDKEDNKISLDELAVLTGQPRPGSDFENEQILASSIERGPEEQKEHNRRQQYKRLQSWIPEVGAGIPQWSDVTTALKADGPTLLQAFTALSELLHQPEYADIISKLNLNDIATVIHDITEFDTETAHGAKALVRIMDDLGNHLELALRENLRKFPAYKKLLEKLRHERIKREGGKLTMGLMEEDREVDAIGQVRVVHNADDVIDTDVIHGTLQRLQIHAVIPELQRRIAASKSRRQQLNAELACLLQFGFEICVPPLQRNWRKWLVRIRMPALMRRFMFLTFQAAACTIGNWARTRAKKLALQQRYTAKLAGLMNWGVVKIQKMVRRYCKYNVFRRYIKKKRWDHLNFAATQFQRIIRGFVSRRRKAKELDAFAELRKTEEQGWAATIIQKIARSYIVRRTIYKALKIRFGRLLHRPLPRCCTFI